MLDLKGQMSNPEGTEGTRPSGVKRHSEPRTPSDDEVKKAKGCLEQADLWPRIKKDYKIFADPIHGSIQLHPVCVAIIDTPEFQRLRDLKQLGLCYHVYPGAAHNRFEHCLGVSHLAGEFVRILQENQPELGITNKDVLCLEIAGLCHDLGHGPFSHVFDGKFVPQCEDIPQEDRDKWKHEQASVKLFNYIYERCENVQEKFTEYDLGPRDRRFIEELILGPKDIKGKKWENEGRDESKAFLYEIVANKRTSIDVDKWDYIARDCHQLGIKNNFDHSRFMRFARVIKGKDSKMQICLREKELVNLYTLFSTRYLLHKNAYQHKVICALDIMVAQALIKANNDIFVDGFKISDIIKSGHWKAYSLLTDNILYKIRAATGDSPNLKEAQKIVERIFSRDFYRCVYESKPGKCRGEKIGEKKREKQERIKKDILKLFDNTDIDKDDFFVQIVNLDFGLKKENPLTEIGAFSKSEPDKVINISENEYCKEKTDVIFWILRGIQLQRISTILRHYTFEEHILRIYVSSKENGDIVKNARDKLDEWARINLLNQSNSGTSGASDASSSTA